MDVSKLSDQQLVDHIEAEVAVPKPVIDEYYRRCIPLYLDFIGIHWHTGFYREQDQHVSPADQVRMIDHIAQLVNLTEGDRVLDVGCGIGATLCHLNTRYGCEVVGLTPVDEQRQWAKSIARSQQAVIQVDLGHAESLPYPDEYFDVITCFESPCHFEDRQSFFNEACRVLKPGGRLAGEDWMAIDLNDSDQQSKWIDPICKTWAIPMLGDAKEYRRLMQAAKLANVDIVDMQVLMPLHKGFAVSDDDISQLEKEIGDCRNPLLELTLRGLLKLGMAVKAGAFTIARFSAIKPPHVSVSSY